MMISGSPFNEPSVLSEQKSSSNTFSYTNFKTSERNLVAMAQVDGLSTTSVHLSPIKAQNIDQNDKIPNHNSNSNDLDDGSATSDIELSLEDSDKETIIESDDAKVTKSNDTNAVKDTESLESIDNDLTNTAHLVRTGFSADEFDQIDCLDTTGNGSNDSNCTNVSNIVNSTSLDNRGKSCDSGKRIDDASVANSDHVETAVTSVKDLNGSEEENLSNVPKNHLQVCKNSAEVERNNNTNEKINKNEKSSESPVELQSTSLEPPKNTVEKADSDVQRSVPNETTSAGETGEEIKLETGKKADESQRSNVNQSVENSISSKSLSPKSEPLGDSPTPSENNPSKPTEKISIGVENDLSNQDETSVRQDEAVSKRDEESPVQSSNDSSKQIVNMSIDRDCDSETLPAEKVDQPDRNCSSAIEESKSTEDVSVDTDSTSQTVPNKNDIDKVDETSENSNSKKIDQVSVDIDSTSNVIPIDDSVKLNKTHLTIAKEVTDINDSSKQTEEISVDSDSPLKIISNEINESKEKRSSTVIEKVTESRSDVCDNDTQEAQTRDSDDQNYSPMIVDDDNDPKSVESAEIIIDSVESEVVELDDDDDLDDTTIVSQTSQQKFNQLFQNTAKEIAHDIGAEVVVGEEDAIPSTSGLTSDDLRGIEISLNRFMPDETESRKRKCQSQQDDCSLKDPLFVEKRPKISETDFSNCTRRDSADRKRKVLNRARKHTSSTNVDKTFQEIEKKLRDDFKKRNNCQKPSGDDIFNEYDFEIHDNDGEIINDTTCDEAAQNGNKNNYKIKLNHDVVSTDNLKNIFKVMRKKLSRRQLEEIVIQKCCEMISDSNEIGTLRRQVADLQQAEMYRKQKILNLEKQISQLKAVCQRYLDQVKETPTKPVTPIKITRSVGLQVARGDSSPFVNLDPHLNTQRGPEKLKKLLSIPMASKKPTPVPEFNQNVPRQSTASPSPSSINHKNSDPRLVNGNARISSPLRSNSPTPCSSPSLVNNSRINKKATKSTNDNAPVIDLTDKDDRTDNETTVATKNLLAVNGYVTYAPMKGNSDQNRQIIKPGTSILVNGQLMTIQSAGKYSQSSAHPAPVPPPPPSIMMPGAKPVPPRPILKIDKSRNGIMLAWEFPPNLVYAEVNKYQLFAYQETNVPPRSDLWKTVGEVSALPLPMACTLTQFVEGYKYHFIVRAVDLHNRCGPFSVPRTITL